MRAWRVVGAVLAMPLAAAIAWAGPATQAGAGEGPGAKATTPAEVATNTNATGDVTIENAWIRAPVAGQTVTAAYCDIRNGRDESVTIVGFAGPMPTEMHETLVQGGMTRMRPVPAFTVAARSTARLAPGGKHLMLFNADQFAGAGADAQVLLRAELATGETLAARFRVRALGADGETRPAGAGRARAAP